MSVSDPSSDVAAAWHLALSQASRAHGTDGVLHELAWRDAALLAWLAIEGPTPRARLAALLWPDSSTESARNSLRQRLFQLRKQVGTDLVAGTTTLALAAGVGHDLADGDGVLGSAPCEVGGEFAQWLELQRGRRHARVRESLVELAEMAERARDWADALVHARELLALEPLSEDAHRRVMRLHYLAGDRAAALLAFDQCEKLLKDEVGAKPSATTLALLATIEQATPRVLAAASPSVPASVLRPPRLIGREREWAAMQEAWHARRCIVVTGEGGMGKTRLTTDFAHSHGRALVVSARPGDARVVYASLSRLLRALPREHLHALPATVRAELSRLLPELGEPAGGSGTEDRTRFFNAAVAALDPRALALEGIVIDDLHFADEASIELLRYAASASASRWLVTARAVELSGAGREWLAALRADAAALALDLPPLTLPQIALLLRSLALEGIDDTLAPDLLRHTGGNPMFLLETLKARLAAGADAPLALVSGGERLPAARGVAALIERRIGQLSMPAIQLARCAAVAAPDFSIELASHVLGRRTIDLADPWAELEAAQVLRDGAFAHDLIYESALASVPRPVARGLHREIAAYLGAHGGEAARVAAHWLEAGDEAAALDALLAAAAAAGHAMRKREQAQTLLRAADIAERLGRRAVAFDAVHAAEQAWMVADRTQADVALLDRLDALADTPQQTLVARMARAEIASHTRSYAEAMRLGEAVAALAREVGDGRREVEGLRCAAQAAAFSGDSARAVRLLRSALPWVLQHAAKSDQQSFFNDLACCLDIADQSGEAQDYHRRALELALELGRLNDAATTCANVARSLMGQGEFRRAWESLLQARRYAAGYDDAQGMTWHIDLLAFVTQRDLAHYAAALRGADELLQALSQHVMALPVVQGHIACLWLHLGQHARAQQLLAEMERQRVPAAHCARWHQLQGRLKLAQQGAASEPLRAALAHAPQAGRTALQAMIALDHALVSEPEAALAECLQVQQRALSLGHAGVALAAGIRAIAMAQRAGRADHAAQLARAALATPEDIEPDDLYRGELWLHAAQAFAGAGRHDDARAAAQAGRDWVLRVAREQVPDAFRDSFVHRNPVNRDLLALAGRLASR